MQPKLTLIISEDIESFENEKTVEILMPEKWKILKTRDSSTQNKE